MKLTSSVLTIFAVQFLFQGSDKDKRKEAAEKEEKAKKVCLLSNSFISCI